MRYILFRGKPTREVLENESLCKTLPIKDGFVYGNLIYNDKQPYIVGPIADVNDEYCSMEWWCPVVKETVGQFTGLKDKNWFTKIFEGDIIRLDGTIGGNIYEEKELLKDTTNLIIKGVGTSSWATTEQEAIMRGCHYAE